MADTLPADLLEILVCPETHQKLRAADNDFVERLRRLQSEGRLLNREGRPVADPPGAALIREDGKFAYLVIDQIPVMLIQEAVALDQLPA
jgi:uncharacterized protein YbaR (Trm112 family)